MNKKGAALLTVLVALLLMSLMTLELQYTSLIEKQLAYNDLSHLQAHYLAKSGIRLGLLRVVGFGRAQNNKVFTNFKQLLPLIWNLPFPPFPAEAADLNRLSLKEKSEQEEALKDTRISVGQFSYSISSEASKINLNLLYDPDPNSNRYDFRSPATTIHEFTAATLYNKIEELFRASENPADEFGNVRADDLVRNLTDWLAPRNVTFGAGNKDAWYERQNPPYKTKGGPFFTLDEIKRVKDISPALFLKLKPFITVFSQEGKVDLNEATQKNTLNSFFPDLREYPLKLLKDAFERRAQNGGWRSVQDFFNELGGIDPVSARFYDQKVRDDFFTVGSENFTIKGQGVIKRSASQIQKTILVSVALERSPCAEILGVANSNACTGAGGFFVSGNRCLTLPKSLNECQCRSNDFNFAFVQNGICKLFTIDGTRNHNPDNSSTASGIGKLPPPNSVKIYSWVES